MSLGEKSLISTTVLDIVTQRVTPDDVDETYVKNFESNKTELLIKVLNFIILKINIYWVVYLVFNFATLHDPKVYICIVIYLDYSVQKKSLQLR